MQIIEKMICINANSNYKYKILKIETIQAIKCFIKKETINTKTSLV